MRLRLRRIAEWTAVVGLILAIAWTAHLSWRAVRVGGWSMHPALHAGDIAIVGVGSAPRVGDVALLRQPGHEAVLHRIMATLPDGAFQTRGDANSTPDREPVSAADIEGRVVALIPVGELIERWRGDGACATMTTQSNSAKP